MEAPLLDTITLFVFKKKRIASLPKHTGFVYHSKHRQAWFIHEVTGGTGAAEKSKVVTRETSQAEFTSFEDRIFASCFEVDPLVWEQVRVHELIGDLLTMRSLL